MLWASYGPHPQARQGHKPLMMALCGLSLLNPLYGVIYWLSYQTIERTRHQGKHKFRGWTIVAELICGSVTASSFIVLSNLTGAWLKG